MKEALIVIAGAGLGYLGWAYVSAKYDQRGVDAALKDPRIMLWGGGVGAGAGLITVHALRD